MRFSERIGSRNCPGKYKVHETQVKKCPRNFPVLLSFSYPWSLSDIIFQSLPNYPGFLDLFQVTKDPALHGLHVWMAPLWGISYIEIDRVKPILISIK